jgi:hypothetical protein
MVERQDYRRGCNRRSSSSSGETLPILKEALVTLTLGWRPLTTWVLVADIADEFVLAPDVLRAQSASVDMKRLVLQMRIGEASLQRPEARPRSSPAERGDSDVAVAWCGRVAAVSPKGFVQMGDSLVGTGSRTANPAEAVAPVQPPQEETRLDEKRPPVTEAHASWRTLKGTAALGTRGPKEGAAGEVGQRQRENRPTRKEGWTPSKLEEELRAPARREGFIQPGRSQTSQHSLRKRDGDTLIGYSERAALRREKCSIFAQSKNWGARYPANARQRLCNMQQYQSNQ